MVKVWLELEASDIISTSKYFNNSYTEEWLDEWAERVISNVNSCGDNCDALLAELSIKKDFAIYLAYPMNFAGLEFDMCIARDGVLCHNAEEFERKYLLWRHSMTF